MKLASLFLFALSAVAQTPTYQSSGPSTDSYVTLFDPSGASGALVFMGQAQEYLQPRAACSSLGSTCLKRVGSTLTNIIDATNTSTVTCATACGVWIGQRVTVSGATVDTDLNGTYSVLTTPSATTYTITTASVSDATYTESTLQISTSQPLTTQTVWTITGFRYDGSGYLISTYYAIASASNPEWRNALAWSARASY